VSYKLRKVKINKSSFEYKVTGKQTPTFILLSGYGEPIESWKMVRHEIDQHGKVFTYNRLGTGGSDQPTSTQCGKTIISDLRAILEKLGIFPPYILVGHSIGGLYAALYGQLYPSEVLGAILIEPTHPDHEERFKKISPPFHVRFVNGYYDFFEKLFNKNTFNEMKSFEVTANQFSSSGSFPDVPLTVITGSKKMPFEPDNLRELHLSNQKELASISSKGKFIIAKDSGHFPQTTQPKLVSEAIVKLIKQVNHENHG
jgi:pimeloyl-ACP methyl ester carboxylesterase